MGKLRFPLLNAGIEILGDFNPQLLRELQGRLKLRNVCLVILCSLIGQGCFLFWQSQQLDLGRGICGETFESRVFEYPARCVQLGTYYLLVNWHHWWMAVFAWGGFVMLLLLILGGSFLLISDLSKEEHRGTLTFISLSPQSAWTILLGKALGVPVLVYLAVIVAVPLHYLSGFSAQLPFVTILSFDLLVVGCCIFFYSVALLIGLVGHWLNGLQAWLGSATILGFLLLCNKLDFTRSPADWIYAFSPVTLLRFINPISVDDFLYDLPYGHYGNLEEWQWLGLPLGSSSLLVLLFVLANYFLWTGLLWQPLLRRFRNSNIPLLSKKQSYGATGCMVTCWLGFSLGSGGNPVEQIGFLLLPHMLWFLLLIILLLPQHQDLQDWARYQGNYRSVKKRIQQMQSLFWADNSPSWVAISINLVTAGFPIAIWIYFFPEEVKMSLLLGLLINSTLILVLALLNQVVLLLPISNRNLWTTAILTVPLVLSLLALFLFGAEPRNVGASLFLFTPLAFLSVPAVSLFNVLAVLGLQLAAVTGLAWQLNRQLHRIGESETAKLCHGNVAAEVRET